MTKLTRGERQLLAQVRAVLRDLAHSWQPDEVEAQAASICSGLSTMLNEEYNFATGDVTRENPEAPLPQVWSVLLDVRETDLAFTLNQLADNGYHINKVQQRRPGFWVVIAFDPVLLGQKAGQSMADRLSGALNLAGLIPGAKGP